MDAVAADRARTAAATRAGVERGDPLSIFRPSDVLGRGFDLHWPVRQDEAWTSDAVSELVGTETEVRVGDRVERMRIADAVLELVVNEDRQARQSIRLHIEPAAA